MGHTESLRNDMAVLVSKIPELDGPLKFENSAKEPLIMKGTVLKYPKELLMLCELYWNDFYCGHYQDEIPEICEEANERQWHMPCHCITLNKELMKWPDHRYKG